MTPDAQPQILPFLVVADALAASEFYKNAFGATVSDSHTHENRTTARINIGAASFFIGDEEPEFQNYSPLKFGGSPVRMVLQTLAPETFFDNAIILGATQICPVTIEESWKIGKLQDPSGHIWEIGCPL